MVDSFRSKILTHEKENWSFNLLIYSQKHCPSINIIITSSLVMPSLSIPTFRHLYVVAFLIILIFSACPKFASIKQLLVLLVTRNFLLPSWLPRLCLKKFPCRILQSAEWSYTGQFFDSFYEQTKVSSWSTTVWPKAEHLSTCKGRSQTAKNTKKGTKVWETLGKPFLSWS